MRASADLDKGTAFLEPVSKVLNEEGSPSIYWSSQDSVETLSARLVSRFELRWTHPAEMTVAPHSIVEGIDVVGHIGDRQLSALVDLFLDPLFLQAAEEGLGDGIVPAVALSAHTRLEAIRATESAPRVAAVLGALIGVNQRTARSAAPHRHQHRIEHELAVNRGAGSPPYDHAREQIHDDGQVEPALLRPDVGDVGDPGLVGPRRRESSLQEIRDQDRWLPDSPAPCAIPVQRAKIGLAHQPGHAMLAAGFARFPEIKKDPRRAVDAVTRNEGSPNQAKEAGILLRTVRNRLLKPLVVAARRDAENATHRLHSVPPSMGLDELIRRANSPGARLRGHWPRPPRVGMLKACVH
jgi:hypothetical protein